jgi:hypothetical protein
MNCNENGVSGFYFCTENVAAQQMGPAGVTKFKNKYPYSVMIVKNLTFIERFPVALCHICL